MKVKGVDHIGIAVNSIDQAKRFYTDGLELNIEGTEDIPERCLKVAFLGTGNARIELIESTHPDSAIAKYLAKRGPGIHHICLEVEDINESLIKLRDEGYKMIDDQPKDGAEGSLVAFVHPKSADGILIELKQIAK